MTITVAAFVMSLAITAINAYYALRGAEVSVLPLEDVIIYREGDGETSVAVAAVRIGLVNVAADRSDILLAAELQLEESGPWFQLEGSVQPDFNNEPAPIPCAGTECIASFRNLLLKDVPDEIIDVPAGSARLRWMKFPLHCTGSRACSNYEQFNATAGALNQRRITLRLRLKFQEDGERDVRCTTAAAVEGQYLREVGWTSLQCATSGVAGEPFL
jgi:hypothetical protein